MASVRAVGLAKVYPNGYEALRRFDLEVRDGEFLVLVGPSGSGKSTVLRLVAGLEAPSEGSVYLDEHDVTALDPAERDIAMVFQSYALYPHKSVRENLGFGLRVRGLPRAEIDARTRAVAERLSLSPLLDRKPAQLSGGQRQRVALGRALVRKPRVFLLDEPLSNLDAKLRVSMRSELGRLHASEQTTTLYVTHDQEEAMTLGQRIAVLGERGRIEQLGTPLTIYERPRNRFVAEFIGLPRINWFEGEVRDGAFVGRDFRRALPVGAGFAQHGRVVAGIRPHDLLLTAADGAGLAGRVELIESLGHALLVHARAEHASFVVQAPAGSPVTRGELVSVLPKLDRLHFFDAETGLRL